MPYGGKLLWINLGGEEDTLVPVTVNYRRFSSQWKNITRSLVQVDDYSRTFISGMGFVLGNGSRIQFWQHEWIPGMILSFAFPRIYALAVLKDGKVKDYGCFENGNWVWTVALRRRLFGWETTQWDQFISKIEEYHVCSSMEDKLIWKGNINGIYTVNSFCREHLCEYDGGNPEWSKVWSDLVPPKVATFCWQMFQGGIAVKEVLVSRGLLQGADIKCPLCNLENETISHLFFSCRFSWNIWSLWCCMWDIRWVCNKAPWSFFSEWCHILPPNSCDKLWRISFYAIVWSIWLYRNEVVFQGNRLDFSQVIELIKCRIAVWTKVKWPDIALCHLDITRCLSNVLVPKNSAKVRPINKWSAPPVEAVKFNVDGSSVGKPGPAGIGGILRDHAGNVKARFSKSIGVADSNLAELMAIREAFLVFLSSPWVNCKALIIESDSKIATGRVLEPAFAPWRSRNLIGQIENLKKQASSYLLNLLVLSAYCVICE
ncbi:hypothetical protein DITRI_Ditri05aG0124900 [Diplodiscus trichospermus]